MRLDWDGLETAGGRVGTIVVSTIAELGGCYFPWYVVHGHGETTWEDARGVALRADDLATCWTDLRPARRQAVLDVAREFERSARPALIVLVAYRLPSGARLLLDGNHRVAALTMRPAPFRALVAEVEGPLDREILPDLARHGG